MIKRFTILSSLLCASLCSLFSQQPQDSSHTISHTERVPRFSIKSNLLYDATGSFNLGAELRLSDKLSLDVPVNYNPWTFSDNRKFKHILIQPELRLWTKESFSGHFFGLHAHYAYYNVGNPPKPFSDYIRAHRFEGWLAGAGVSYGYRHNFSRHWAMEVTLGVGYVHMNYDKYSCVSCGEKIGSGVKNFVGPTKAALNLVYSFGGKGKTKAIPAPTVETVIPVAEEQAKIKSVVPYIPQLTAAYTVPAVENVKERSESGEAYLDFASGQSAIVAGFKNNAAELEKIHKLIASVKNTPDLNITCITITGYASPEGTYAANLSLSQKRADALKNHIKTFYNFPESMFRVEGKGEDWQTLDSLVSHSSISEKYFILEIIRGTDIFDGREHKLMMLSDGSPYRQMKAELYPRLRRTEYRLHYRVQPFSIDKGKEVLRVKPSFLSQNEMYLIAGTYEPGSEAFNEVFETAARLFPDDDTAKLNAAASALNRKDTVMAEAYLKNIKVHTAAYHNNMGVFYGLRDEWDKAADAFARAKEQGSQEAVHNLKEIRKKINE